jgi:hypothetical protein
MTSALRKFESVALCGWLLTAMLAFATPAQAQTDLNQFVPRISFGKSNFENYERDPAADEPVRGQPAYQQSQRAKSNQPNNGNKASQANQPPRPSQQPRRQAAADRAESQASYQSSAARYQNPRYQQRSSAPRDEIVTDEEAMAEEEAVNSYPPQRATRRPMNAAAVTRKTPVMKLNRMSRILKRLTINTPTLPPATNRRATTIATAIAAQ